VEQAEVEKLVGELEVAVDRLRSLYEQYFMGIEKLEPLVPRKDVDRRIHVLRREQIRNTALRFRFQMILQRYSTYEAHWQRICREIENGTYERHVARAKKRFGGDARLLAAGRAALAAPGAPVLDREGAAELAELDREFASAAPAPSGSPAAPAWRRTAPAPARAPAPTSPAAPASPAGRSPVVASAAAAASAPAPAAARAPIPAPAPARPDDLPEERLRQLYAQYVETKRRHNESTAAITYEAVARSLRDSSAKLRERHGKRVDFEVCVKDGKTILRPVLKE
jgi:hypothetical protein